MGGYYSEDIYDGILDDEGDNEFYSNEELGYVEEDYDFDDEDDDDDGYWWDDDLFDDDEYDFE